MTWTMPDSISPSRMGVFAQCPLRFRVETMQKLPSKTGAAALAGTTSHLALEWLMDLDGPERTRDTLDALVLKALAEIKEGDEYKELTPEELKDFDAKVKRVTPRLFDMIDVPGANVYSTEQRIEVDLDGWTLRGIIDLLLGTEERLYLWDHKTGRTPSEKYQAKAMQGIHFYALVIKLHLDVIPAKIALGYLDSRTKISFEPTEQSVSATRSKVLSTRDAIQRCCDTDDFRPTPSKLCDWCPVQPWCPSHGGNLDEVPVAIQPGLMLGSADE